jgi:hypothetical protein
LGVIIGKNTSMCSPTLCFGVIALPIFSGINEFGEEGRGRLATRCKIREPMDLSSAIYYSQSE